ncbi:bacterial group 3 Ig-like protein [Leptospira broomii serovar Hurstbridge str. 5399]|uniref:Bacterial group 3 Ig-like protein n=1 Tax=Leptospira broomii serovar Hurstbridge str. 5399 TaxID=1049789 RepID=T0F6D3_9LEPT|nr:hypothetical protein [Leptospira broomii]EQA46670.1 bacterial group 3 Ig-like protein [Leptospira broomii serovar Hurstbridge str. 5399]
MNTKRKIATVIVLLTSSLIFAQSGSDKGSMKKTSEDSERTNPKTGNKNDPSASIYVNFKNAVFEIDAVDDSSQVDYVEYKIDDSDYIRYSGPVYLSKEGLAKISYRSVDKAGNKEALRTVQILVDNTAPELKLTANEGSLKNISGNTFASRNVSYTISATDALSGIKEVKFSVNGGEYKSYEGQPMRLEKQGVNWIRVTAIDKSGNNTDMLTVVTVDDEKPNVEIISSIPLISINGKQFVKQGTVFSVKAGDSLSGVSQTLYKIDKGEWTSFTKPIAVTTSGEHSIEVRAVDNVGNESDLKKVSFVVDMEPPHANFKKAGSNRE